MAVDLSLVRSAFCIPQDVHTVLGKAGSLTPQLEATMTIFINLFSTGAEGSKFCNRPFYKGQYEEFYDGSISAGNYRYLRNKIIVKAPPIESGSLAIFDDNAETPTYDNTTRLTENTHYTVDYSNGIIESIYTFGCGYKNLKVVYNGGLVKNNPDEGILEVPEDLRTACALQVGHWFRQRENSGASAISVPGGGSVTFMEPTQILPMVWNILINYKRFEY